MRTHTHTHHMCVQLLPLSNSSTHNTFPICSAHSNICTYLIKGSYPILKQHYNLLGLVSVHVLEGQIARHGFTVKGEM